MASPHFTVAYWCVLVVALMPVLCAMLAKGGAFRLSDNHDPRRWLQAQSGWRARANAAQANCFEALAFFIGAVIIAHQLGASQDLVDALAVAFVLLRVLFVVLYVADKPTARSLVFSAALVVNVAILFAGYR